MATVVSGPGQVTVSEPTNAEKLRRLPWSIASNAANTVFLQLTFFGSVFVLFLSQLGMSKPQIGFLLSLLAYAGLLALFVGRWVRRVGYKRAYLTFFGSRNLAAACILATPWVAARFGVDGLATFIAGVLLVFALVRAIGVTAAFPWAQEYVPNSVRGKYTATSSLFTTIAALVTISVASFVIERSSGLTGFMILIGVGLAFGLLSVWLASFIPGGAPDRTAGSDGTSTQSLLAAARDKTLWLYLGGVGLVMLATTPLASFLPLFMEEQIGLSKGNIVLLQNGSLIGGLITTYLWGWASDRYGSKPVMISGILIRLLLPIAWFVMPRGTEASLYVALGIALVQGIADMGWAIGSGRILYVSVVPPEKKGEYMSLYYAWLGLSGGTSQFIGGQLLAWSQGVSGQFMGVPLDQYTTLFVLGFFLLLISLSLLGSIQTRDEVSVREFAWMFLQGNPLIAMESVIRYHMARDERAAVSMTELLGASKSPLTVDELLEALADPRFNVRFEAIISIARTKADPRLIEALRHVLEGSELSLSVVAAWALGRLGDDHALPSLRSGLDSQYRSIRAHCARALGTIGDQEIISLFIERLDHEPDKGLQMAYASTLGKLRAGEATELVLRVLEETDNEGARLELALALARVVGDEAHFIRLVRQARGEAGTTLSQAMAAFKRKAGRVPTAAESLPILIDNCADHFARDRLAEAAGQLEHIVNQLPPGKYDQAAMKILTTCLDRLAHHGAERLEYILLTIHTLEVGWQA